MRVVIIHYTAPPVIGGVEAVILAHARELVRAGYATAIIAGRGEPEALPPGVELVVLPEMDTRHAEIQAASELLEQGQVPDTFDTLAGRLEQALGEALQAEDVVVVHNIFGKHFNLPLTAALFRLMDAGAARRWIFWGHDFSWTSPNSQSKVHPGYPWDLLWRKHPRMVPVAVSQQRQAELAGLYGVPTQQIRVIYNGVDAQSLLGLSDLGLELAERMFLLDGDLNLLMPVRVTTAKNIELALRVTAALKRMGVQARLLVSGPPDPHDEHSLAYYNDLRALRSRLDLDDEMHFVYELGDAPGETRRISEEVVGELYRLCDVMIMPSHREGFGMPVLEAGLAGLQVFSSPVPAAVEIASEEAVLFAADDSAEVLARRLAEWAEGNPVQRLRRKVRQEYTWTAIFRQEIEPLLLGEQLR